MIERLATNKKLYPLWRTFPKLEAAFFAYAKWTQRGSARPAAFGDILGFDVSYYQGVINFQTVKDYGARFVIIRSSYGINQDTKFTQYMTGFAPLLPVSVYHFYDPQYSPITQAEKTLAVIEPFRSKIKRVWLDMEYTWAGGYEAARHWKTYRDIIKAAGYRFGWYTRKTWWDARVTATEAAEFAVDPVWAAQYSSALTLIPEGWTKAMFWQRGALPIGPDAGVSSPNLDVNYWNTEYSFAGEWNLELPQTGATMKQGILTPTTTVLNVRSAPNSTTNNIIATILTGDKVYGEIDAASGWLKIQYIIRANGTRENYAVAYCSANSLYITLTDYTPVVTVKSVTYDLAAGSKITTTYTDGTQKVETA